MTRADKTYERAIGQGFALEAGPPGAAAPGEGGCALQVCPCANSDREAGVGNRDGREERTEGGRLPAANTIPVFRLYVSGATPKSTRAISNLKRSLDSVFNGRYELAVIDIHAEPHKAKAAGVHATPMLVKVYPPPVRTVVGSLSSKECIRRMLGAGNQYGSGGKPYGKQSDEN